MPHRVRSTEPSTSAHDASIDSLSEPAKSGSPGQMAPPDAEITALLQGWQDGDEGALEELMSSVYDELKIRAQRYIRGEKASITLQTGDLVHEVYFRFVGIRQSWDGRNHFFAIIAKKMREFLVDRARARLALRRGGHLAITGLKDHDAEAQIPIEVLDLHEALEDLARFDERKAEILEQRYFGGMLNSEIAEGLGVSESTVEREQRLARAWLKNHLNHS